MNKGLQPLQLRCLRVVFRSIFFCADFLFAFPCFSCVATRSYVTNPKWILGFAIYVFGNISNAFALTFASQSIITPLNSVNLVANTMLAPIFLGETLRQSDVYATALIIAGCTVTVLFGSHDDTVFTLHDLITNMQRTTFVAYATSVASV